MTTLDTLKDIYNSVHAEAMRSENGEAAARHVSELWNRMLPHLERMEVERDQLKAEVERAQYCTSRVIELGKRDVERLQKRVQERDQWRECARNLAHYLQSAIPMPGQVGNSELALAAFRKLEEVK